MGCGGYWVANSHGQPYFIKLLPARRQTVAFFGIKARHNTTDKRIDHIVPRALRTRY